MAERQAYRVLVADDSKLIRWKVGAALRGAGMEVDEAEDGEEALRLARSIRPDAIVMDRAMPNLDGLEAARRLRLDNRTHTMRVVMLTSNATPGDRHLAAQHGVNAFVAKPFRDDALVAVVAEQAQRARARRYAGGRPPRVLLVDDASLVRMRLGRALAPRGFELAEASSGKEALRQARSAQPDVVIMDVNMPDMDGLSATREMRLDAELHHIPVIVLTANTHSNDIRKALEVGVNDYMLKPFEDAVVLARIDELLGVPAGGAA